MVVRVKASAGSQRGNNIVLVPKAAHASVNDVAGRIDKE